MPAYSFEALTADGDTRKGILQADTARAARGQLRAQALVPVQVQSVGAATDATLQQAQAGRGWLGKTLWSSRVFDATDLAVWTRQVAGLASSGLPLERALASLSDESQVEAQRNLVAHLRSEVNAGSSFAKALSQHPREFSAIYVAVIGAGEQSGHLGLVLERLADDLEEQQALKAKLMGAALYPAIVTGVAIVIVMFLLGYVVPQVANVFAGSKRALPWLTIIMLGLGNFVRDWGWLLLFAIFVIAFCVSLSLKNVEFREWRDVLTLKLPVVGRLIGSYNAARFANTLGLLASAGVPILKALQAAADTLANTAMRNDALQILVLVREGAPLASALGQKKRFPGLLAMFARLGEQTGQLPVMLGRAAKQLSTEVQRRALQLATIAEPLLIVAMGLVVMLIVLAVLLPIIQLNQLVK